MDNEKEEFVFEETAFDENGIQSLQSDEVSIPTQRNTSPIQNAAQGFKQGFDAGLNGMPNSALGVNNLAGAKPASPNFGKKNPLRNNENKLSQGQENSNKPNNAQEHKNPLPGAAPNKKPISSNNDNNKKPNDKNDKGFNPRKGGAGLAPGGIANNIKSRLGLGKNKNKEEDNSEKSHTQEAADNLKKGVKTIWAALPITTKAIVVGSSLIIVVILLLALILLSAITGSLVGEDCDSPSYAVNSSDATEFLCNMQSPFNGNGFTVTGVSGWRTHPISGGVKFHEGTDVVGKDGSSQKIYAVADGKVVVAGIYGGYGNAVKINHNDNFSTLYGHLSAISSEAKAALKNSTEIKAGTFLGIQGSTGNSTGVHLHFEVRDSGGKYVSANPYFGYSDQGYEQCVNPNKAVSSSSDCVKSDTPTARYIGQEGFAQICGKTNAYTSNASGSSNSCCGTKTSTNTGNIFNFISVWEGGTGEKYQCNGGQGYKAYQNSGDVLTVGPGLTGQYLGGAKKAGDCVAKTVVEANYKKAEAYKRSTIQKTFASANLTSYQEDAMTSMAYNGCGTFFANIAKAAKNDDLSEVWKAMKGCVNAGTQFELGLQRRRKAEFALFVTGDYSEETAKSYKSKSWTKTEYDNYDSEGVVAKKASGTSSTTCSSKSSSSSTSEVINVAIKELNSWNNYNTETQYCDAIKKYISSCGGGSVVTDYCAGFVTYALKGAGVYDSLGLPSTTCVVSDFKKSSKVTVHNAGGSYTPKPGDLFVKKDSGGNDWGHIGLVEKVEGKTIHTIEGNTDPFGKHCNKGASDGHGGTRGDGTIRRKTHVDDITHFISY